MVGAVHDAEAATRHRYIRQPDERTYVVAGRLRLGLEPGAMRF
jgi:hypothetical protein